MFTIGTKLRGAAAASIVTAALTGLGAGTANAADWPTLKAGAYLYSGTTGTGTVTEVDLGDLGTCHTLAGGALSVQIADGSASLEFFSETGCTGTTWRSGSLAQTDLPWAVRSYRVMPA